MDISVSTLNVNDGDNKITASTYLHPFEVSYLLEEKNNFEVKSLSDALKYKEEMFYYIQDSISFKNNESDCVFISANIPPQNEIEIMGNGLEVQYEIACPDQISILEYANFLFIDDFELQTNKMLFFKNGDLSETIYEKVLTGKIFNDKFDFNHPEKDFHPDRDTDGDGLTDREENMYLTNINLPDTDFDGYSDKEEAEGGFDPRNPEAMFGQIQQISVEEAKKELYNYLLEQGKRENAKPIQKNATSNDSSEKTLPSTTNPIETKQNTDDEIARLVEEIDKDLNKTEEEDQKILLLNDQGGSNGSINNQKPKLPNQKITVTSKAKESTEINGAAYFKTERLSRYLDKIKGLFESERFWPKLLIFVFVFILGLLHAFEPGHGKSILVTYLIDGNKGVRDAFRFSGSLTITHLLDVILLGLAFKLFALMSDVSRYIGSIQKIAIYSLLVIAFFMLIRSFHPKKVVPDSPKKGVVLGIIAGLAPCTIGWALMITIISLNQINWLIPIIIVFGLGIFSSMMGLSLFVLKIREKIYSKSFNLMRLAPVLSSSLLFFMALVLAIKVS